MQINECMLKKNTNIRNFGRCEFFLSRCICLKSQSLKNYISFSISLLLQQTSLKLHLRWITTNIISYKWKSPEARFVWNVQNRTYYKIMKYIIFKSINFMLDFTHWNFILNKMFLFRRFLSCSPRTPWVSISSNLGVHKAQDYLALYIPHDKKTGNLWLSCAFLIIISITSKVRISG